MTFRSFFFTNLQICLRSPGLAACYSRVMKPFKESTKPKDTSREDDHATRKGFPILLPTEDPAAYERHTQSFLNEYQPKSFIEEQLVQFLIDNSWRVNRYTAIENTLLSMGDTEIRDCNNTSQTGAQAALATIRALGKHERALANLSLWRRRLTQSSKRTLAMLREIQAERRKKEQERFRKAFENVGGRPMLVN
jgi:hypothetical protein